jgi:hypothetical protein
MGPRERGVADTAIAEIRMFVSCTEEDDPTFRASVFAGPNIGPEEPRLQREEFTGGSLDEAVGPAMKWAGDVLRSAPTEPDAV